MYSVPLSGNQQSGIISIGTNISSDNASIANASITSLSVVNFKSATFSPHTINTSTINASSISLDPNFVFPVLNVATLNSIEESFVNVSAVNISANNITADNIQPLLTAGDNITIDANNTISALNNNLPATGNFTTLNTSQLNASNISTGDLTFDSHFTLSNKFLTVNSTTNITENSPDLITSGAVYNAINRFSTNISDGRSLTNTKLIEGGDVIKPIVPGTVSTIDTEVPAGTSKNIMKVFYTTKFGENAILSAVANFGYQVSGDRGDKITARLEYNNGSNNNIGQQEQMWTDGAGGGTRSGVLSPRQGVRRSAVPAQTQVYFQLIIQNDSDDTFTFLTPDACNFHITESLDNAGSDLNLNTGDLQADAANFNSLTVQAGSGSGQATIGRTYLGNNAFGNMACLSVNGNDGATNYGFAQVANNQTIMNAMPTAYNSFRCENVEVASIGQIGLGIGLGQNNTASFPLEVSGDSLVSGVMFASEIDTTDALMTNISNTNLSGTNATFQEINVSGNLIVNGTTFTTTNLTAGENITITDNVISAFFGSGGQVNLNHIQVDGGVDIGGVLNVSQTSNFSNSVNVGDILYAGVAGNHEGSVVIYSNNVGDNYTTKINSSTFEVNTSATGNISAINFFVGNNKPLEITNTGVNALNLSTNDFFAADLEADVFKCIDGSATFRFNTPQINASDANFSNVVVDGTLGIGIDDPERLFHVRGDNAIWRLDRDRPSPGLQIHRYDTNFVGDPLKGFIIGVNANGANDGNFFINDYGREVSGASTPRFSIENDGEVIINVGLTTDFGNFSTVNVSNLNITNGNMSTLTIDGAVDVPLTVPNGQANFNALNVSRSIAVEGSDMFIGNAFLANNIFGGPPRSRISFYSTTNMFSVGTRMGINENNEAFLSLEPFGGVENYTISINNVSTMNMTETDTTFNNKLIVSNISGDGITANTIDTDMLITDTLNLNDPSTGLDTTIERSGGNTTLTSIAGSVIFNTNSNSTNRAMIIGQDNLIQTRTIQNAGLLESRNISVDENVSVTASLTATNMEVMNNVDIYNDLFVANRIDATIIDGIDVVGDNGDFGLLDANTIRATTSNSSTTNASNGNFSSLNVNATGTFQSVVANNVNVAGTLNATNIPNYQETLTAGSNISIVDNVISAIVEEFPADANFSSVTTDVLNTSTINASNIVGYQETLSAGSNINLINDVVSVDANPNFSTINADTSIINTMNSSVINTSFFSCIDEAGFDGTLNGNIISCNGFDADEVVAIEVDATRIIGDTARIEAVQTDTLNISDPTTGLATTLDRAGGNTTMTSPAGAVIFNTNPQSTSRAMIIGQDNIITTQTVQNVGLLESRNISVDENVSVSGSLSVDTLTIDGRNASTTSVVFSDDFLFNTFDYTLRLAEDPQQAVASALEDGVDTPSVNTSSIDTIFATMDVASVTLSFNSVTNNLFNINSSGTANISVINNSTLNSITGNFSTINADNLSTASISFNSTDFNFANDELSLATSASQIKTNTINEIKDGLSFNPFSVLDDIFVVNSEIVSVGQSLSALQSTITTMNSSTINSSVVNGDNLSTASISFNPTDFNFVGGELSLVGDATLPADANFSSVTTEVLNASTINASNIVGYQETLIAGDNISIVGNTISAIVGGGSGGTGIDTIAIAKINGDGTNLAVIGCSVTRSGTGKYIFTFDTEQPNNDYVVQMTVMEDISTVDDIIITFDSGTATTTSFKYSIHEQDNSGTAGVYRDKAHFITVSASGSGGGGGGGGGSLPSDANFSSVTADTANITNLTIGDKLDRKQNIVCKSNGNTIDLNGLTFFNLITTTDTNSVSFVSYNAGAFTFSQAGLYKVSAHVLVYTSSYNSRIDCRLTPLLNNVYSSNFPIGHGYIRGVQWTVRYCSPCISFMVNINANDVMTFVLDQAKATNGTFGDDMTGTQVENQSLMFEYLGA